jgi:hypothetical protein
MFRFLALILRRHDVLVDIEADGFLFRLKIKAERFLLRGPRFEFIPFLVELFSRSRIGEFEILEMAAIRNKRKLSRSPVHLEIESF